MRTANLSTLINWLYQAEDLGLMMQNLKEMGDADVLRQIFGMASGDKTDPMQMIENSLEFIKELEFRVHQELRKPEKEWNYSKEED